MGSFVVFISCMVITYAALAWIDRIAARPTAREEWAASMRRALKTYAVVNAARATRARVLYAQMMGRATRPIPGLDRPVGVPEQKPREGSAMETILRHRVLAAKARGEGRFNGAPVHVFRDHVRRMVQVWHLGDDDHEGRWMTEMDFIANHGEYPKEARDG